MCMGQGLCVALMALGHGLFLPEIKQWWGGGLGVMLNTNPVMVGRSLETGARPWGPKTDSKQIIIIITVTNWTHQGLEENGCWGEGSRNG